MLIGMSYEYGWCGGRARESRKEGEKRTKGDENMSKRLKQRRKAVRRRVLNIEAEGRKKERKVYEINGECKEKEEMITPVQGLRWRYIFSYVFYHTHTHAHAHAHAHAHTPT